MKALIQREYDAPALLTIEDVEEPIPGRDQVLIRILAASVNGSDKENLKGSPLYTRLGGLMRPRNPIPG